VPTQSGMRESWADVVTSDEAPAAIGPYSAGIRVRAGCGLVFVSGQLPLDPQSGETIQGDAGAQVTRALRNGLAVVEAAGSRIGDIVRVTVYVSDMTQFALINDAYAKFFGDWHPARAVVEVSRLPRDCSLEVDMIAVVPTDR